MVLQMNEVYTTECQIECIDNGKVMEGEVDVFKKGKYLSVYVNTVKVNLQYSVLQDKYIGSMGELEFISQGPKLLGRYR